MTVRAQALGVLYDLAEIVECELDILAIVQLLYLFFRYLKAHLVVEFCEFGGVESAGAVKIEEFEKVDCR